MWIDTHCHLDAEVFDADRDAVVARARAAGVAMCVLAAGHPEHFAQTVAVAQRYGYAYALGIHPLWVDRAAEDDVERVREALAAHRDDPRLVAVGEIGLDFYVAAPDHARQEWFYREQLRLAREAGLPVILHVRRSADALAKHLRRIVVPGGIAHAYNGSREQALALLGCGLRLGFGGALTYEGSRRIRAHAAELADTAWVLETDSPDIAPAWLRSAERVGRNEPAELPRIAQIMAGLRGCDLAQLAGQARVNSVAALPRLAALLPPD
jgi:TatD DNase family protein